MKIPQHLYRILSGEFNLTPPVIALRSANLITIVLAVAGNWDISAAMNRSYTERGETGTVGPGRVRTQAWILGVFLPFTMVYST